ncbi:3'(2'),5'-bisphosphate nucleotidase CysQ [Demequina zhanjiangensis]|uniref:3'(2'),5-bisphosphonucleoside 3'(2')-phosphohydrolase n=1 Tax=Demequina zhanjiangensis TaxID=3051659 RepID=A0ABT8G4A0_9MICO|nr:3'(2'),5'-bisphosphate nucleotidase CysQ [Demequina sp. SYSU T00b26]MDN4473975.1 3'(2'),5'-bisphosphate nucleotidase CysQ [Demequina sp. SYSU T00b26]
MSSTPDTAQAFAKHAASIARRAGVVLLEAREDAKAQGVSGRALGALGDARAQEAIASWLADEAPGDAVLSEEAKDTAARLDAERVWIIDPLDGTREYSEGRDDWAVHVAVWEAGELIAGAVAIPGEDLVLDSASITPPSAAAPEQWRMAVSRSRPPALVEHLRDSLDLAVVPMGSAGVKVSSVIRGQADAYVHAGGQYEWDSAAPVAVARAAGLHTSRIDGTPLTYNRRDPYLPDLVVCRPELASPLLAAIAQAPSFGDHQ